MVGALATSFYRFQLEVGKYPTKFSFFFLASISKAVY